jgi:hypothetical protein
MTTLDLAPSVVSLGRYCMSTTAATYPIVTALVEAEKILGPDRQWKPANEVQARFLTEYFAVCRHEKVPEIESLASWDGAGISEFLAQRGFHMTAPAIAPPFFATASVLNLPVEWAGIGVVTVIRRGLFWLRKFPAVRIPFRYVRFFRSAGHRHPIAQVSTKSGDDVYMTMHKKPRIGFDLVARAQELSRDRRPVYEYGGLVFPMIKLEQGVDIDWLVGIETTELHDQPALVGVAIQQTRLRVNEVGARAESAVVAYGPVTASRFGPRQRPKPDHVIKRPFLIWFERKGLSKPLFVGHIAEQDWKNPGGL